jgi:hypothetical protein
MVLFLLLFGLSACADGKPASDDDGTPAGSARKKLIDLSGFAHPFVGFLQHNLPAMQGTTPFGGLVFIADPRYGAASGRHPWLLEDGRWSEATVDAMGLEALEWGQFSDNFVRLNTVHSSITPDWFDDQRWQVIAYNMRLIARVARLSGSRGIAYDPEPYGLNPWRFDPAQYPDKHFDEVCAKVRQRGQEVMNAWQGEFPDIVILSLYGPLRVYGQYVENDGDVSRGSWGLFGAFLNGMLDVIAPGVTLIDGNEHSYYYLREQAFAASRDDLNAAKAVIAPENHATYQRQVALAQALYVDGLLNLWDTPRFFGYFLASDDERRALAEHNTYHGLNYSDEYLWVYAENMDWWGVKTATPVIPEGLPALLERALTKVLHDEPLGFDISEAVERANAAFRQRRWIEGDILKHGLDFTVRVESTNPSGACLVHNVSVERYRYECIVPNGWSGTLTPVSSVRFSPPSRSYSNLTESLWAEDFVPHD